MLISFAKNRVRFSLFSLALAFLMTSNIYATAPTPIGVSSYVKVVSEEGIQAIALYIPETNAPKVLIKIKDSENELLFQKRVKVENGYAQKFNLRDLEDGKYQLIISDKQKMVKQAFQITGDNIVLSKSEKTTFIYPTVQYHESKKLMRVITLDEESVEVNVYDSKGNIIVTETAIQYASKPYNLSSLKKGDYTVEVICGEEVYHEVIQL